MTPLGRGVEANTLQRRVFYHPVCWTIADDCHQPSPMKAWALSNKSRLGITSRQVRKRGKIHNHPQKNATSVIDMWEYFPHWVLKSSSKFTKFTHTLLTQICIGPTFLTIPAYLGGQGNTSIWSWQLEFNIYSQHLSISKPNKIFPSKKRQPLMHSRLVAWFLFGSAEHVAIA